MNADYNTAITVMPDGRVYEGEHDSVYYPRSNALLGRYKFHTEKAKKGLVAKTMLNPRLTSLSAKLVKNPDAALSAASTVADKSNISHLQMLRLYPQAQGVPTEYFYLDEMYVPRDVAQLEGREPFFDTTATAEYKDRMEKSKATHTVYDEIVYNLKKLSDSVYTPIEDMMRTIINPQSVDMSQLTWGFKWKRNQTAATVLADIGNTQSTLDNPAAIDTSGFHSKYHVAQELNDLFNSFLKANDVQITHVAMNTSLFTKYSENTWTVSGPANIEPIRLAGGGVVPLPGIPGVTAVVDVAVPDNTIYAINKPNALRLGEAAKIMRRYYDEERDAEAIKVIDFHQYLATNKQFTKIQRKFGMTIPVSTSS